MTAFFVGGMDARGARAESAYGELCELSQGLAGSPARLRRIHKLRCRFDGSDQEIEVGKPLTPGSGVVSAIIDHGRMEAFVVHTTAVPEGIGEQVRIGNPVYGVTEFSQRA
jgi:hypothetical protein